jgi:hypothetical protein
MRGLINYSYVRHKRGRYRYGVVPPVVISTCIKCSKLSVGKRRLEIVAAHGEVETLEAGHVHLCSFFPKPVSIVWWTLCCASEQPYVQQTVPTQPRMHHVSYARCRPLKMA